MKNCFQAYWTELQNRDLDVKTKTRYWEVIRSYRNFLNGRQPDVASAQEFLATLRSKGYKANSVLLYYHALRSLFTFLGVNLKIRLRKPKHLPPYYDIGDIEALIAQAQKGIRAQNSYMRQRNATLIMVLAFTGMRRGELVNLRVGDVDFERRGIFIKDGKGQKDRTIPMLDRLVVPLRQMCEGKTKKERMFHDTNERSVYRIVSRLPH